MWIQLLAQFKVEVLKVSQWFYHLAMSKALDLIKMAPPSTDTVHSRNATQVLTLPSKSPPKFLNVKDLLNDQTFDFLNC